VTITPSISVIVPVHLGGEPFLRCLRSIQASCVQPDEVIVVLDGAPDSAADMANDFGARVLRTPVGSGPARARNLGAAAASGDILFFVDSDVLIPPSAVDEVGAVFRSQPDLAALIGSYNDRPEANNFLSQYKNLFHHYVHQTGREEAFTFWGACGAIRRTAFVDIGGYDERYRHSSIEDIELGYRLRAAGHRIRMCKWLQVTHLKRWSAGSLFVCDFFRRALPWTELILRTRSLENDLNIDRSSRIKVALLLAMLVALATAWWWMPALVVAAVLALVLIALDLPLLRFFRQKRGTFFALRTIPWHWLYYWICGMGFAIGTLKHAFRREPTGLQSEPPVPKSAGARE